MTMIKTQYELNCPSDGFAPGGLLTIYDNGGPTIRSVLERSEHGLNASWHVVDDNPNFPREMLPVLLSAVTALDGKKASVEVQNA
jgi:hypothetical protein